MTRWPVRSASWPEPYTNAGVPRRRRGIVGKPAYKDGTVPVNALGYTSTSNPCRRSPGRTMNPVKPCWLRFKPAGPAAPPTPVTEKDCCPCMPIAVRTNCSSVERGPAAVGWKPTVASQRIPGLNLRPGAQFDEKVKSPLLPPTRPILTTVRVVSPGFRIDIVRRGALVPSGCAAKSIHSGWGQVA